MGIRGFPSSGRNVSLAQENGIWNLHCGSTIYKLNALVESRSLMEVSVLTRPNHPSGRSQISKNLIWSCASTHAPVFVAEKM